MQSFQYILKLLSSKLNLSFLLVQVILQVVELNYCFFSNNQFYKFYINGYTNFRIVIIVNISEAILSNYNIKINNKVLL